MVKGAWCPRRNGEEVTVAGTEEVTGGGICQLCLES